MGHWNIVLGFGSFQPTWEFVPSRDRGLIFFTVSNVCQWVISTNCQTKPLRESASLWISQPYYILKNLISFIQDHQNLTWNSITHEKMVHFAYFPWPLAEGLVCFYPPAKMEALFLCGRKWKQGGLRRRSDHLGQSVVTDRGVISGVLDTFWKMSQAK